MNKRTAGVNYTRFQCYEQRRPLRHRNIGTFSSFTVKLLIYSLGPDSSLYPLSVLRPSFFDMPSLDMLCKRQRGRLTVKLENVPIFSGRNDK